MYYSHGTLVGLDDFTNLYDVIKIFNIIIIHFELDIPLSSQVGIWNSMVCRSTVLKQINYTCRSISHI